MKIPFVGPSYNVEAVSFDCQRAINLYVVMSESGSSKSDYALRKTPGLKKFLTAPGGPIRGCNSATAIRAFVVSAQFFLEVNADGSTTQRGELATQSVRVSIAESPTQIMVVDGQDGWIFTKATNVWAKIAAPDFLPSSSVTYQDGYFIAKIDGTRQYAISELYDGTLWNVLDRKNVDSLAENLSAVYSYQGNLYCFGGTSGEVHEDTGDAGFPFSRIPGAYINVGCEAPHTIQEFDSGLALLGTDKKGRGVVWKVTGYTARRISTSSIEKQIRTIRNNSTAWAFVYNEEGHLFYCLQVPGLTTTLCTDAATSAWHERMWMNLETNTMELHRASCFFTFNNKNYIGDRANGDIFEMSLEFYDDDGSPQVWKRISPHQQGEKEQRPYSSFELDLDVGRGLVTGQGSDPQICMRYSRDGGRTWSSELWRSLGKIGAYFKRVIWRQLGQARDMVFEVSGSDPVFIQINEAYVNAT